MSTPKCGCRQSFRHHAEYRVRQVQRAVAIRWRWWNDRFRETFGGTKMADPGSSSGRREPRLGSVEELARVMLRHRRDNAADFSPIIFFVGAGCSVSAGVPTGRSIAEDRTLYLARKYLRTTTSDPTEAYNAMLRAKHFHPPSVGTGAPGPVADVVVGDVDWGHVYDQIFDDHIRAAPEIRDYFGSICDQNRVKLNWSHLCLGELVRRKDVSTIITTNFDQLVLRGLVQGGLSLRSRTALNR
jgi:hypothetical protein